MGFLRDPLWDVIVRIPRAFWLALTWLGDSGLLLPAAASVTLWLSLSRRTWPTARLWVVMFGGVGLIVLCSKLAFMGWGIGSARFNFTGFSGHTALSGSIWPVVFWLMASRRRHPVRVGAAFAGWALALVIGVSRLALFAHSSSEVVTGLVLGVATSAGFLLLQEGRPHSRIPAVVIAVSLLLPLTFLSPGTPAPTQGLLEGVAKWLAGTDRVYTRADLLMTR
ncbi:phosphatase PAP2 family protein [Variovorax humicola]|uniref:Phosphatase PAP2 family protein n=1 Tax=Variovorax humicola TaxID=1769758 RepID=A0ABU8W434_9BURK